MSYPQHGPQGPQPYQQPYGPPYQPPMHPVPYGYAPPAHGKVVTKQKIGAAGNSVHLILTVVSCGAWAPIWFLIWLLTRKKTVTRY